MTVFTNYLTTVRATPSIEYN